MKKASIPANVVVLVIFLVSLAIVLLLSIYFSKSIKSSEAFNTTTNFSKVLKWG